MQKKLNDIEKVWDEINIGLQCADLHGATQRIRKMVYMLKMLRIDIETVMDKPFPKMGIGKLLNRNDRKRVESLDFDFSEPVTLSLSKAEMTMSKNEDGRV